MAMPLAPGRAREGTGVGGLQMELGAQLGLFGIIAITEPSTPRVDREFILTLPAHGFSDAAA